MSVKDECKTIIGAVFGPLSAKKVDAFSVDPKECVNQSVKFVTSVMGEGVTKEKFKDLIAKYC